MIKRILTIALIGAAIIGNTGCNKGGDFKKTHGLEYKVVKAGTGRMAKLGDVVEFHIIANVDTLDPTTKKTNSLEVGNTYKQGRAAMTRVQEIKQSGQFQSLFPMLKAGDSAIVHISCDTLLQSIPPEQRMRVPSWLKAGNRIVINLKMVSVMSEDEAKKAQQAEQQKMQDEAKAKAEQQMPIDDKILQDYFAKNNIKAQKTASGLYYTIQKPGSGEQIAANQTVSVKYTGKTLDGKAFDSNIDTTVGHHGTDPLTFPVGQGQMIPGMDEGVALLKKGSKATFYMPSPLAYGEHSPSPNIAPNSILVFDVEVTDVKAAKPQGPGGMGKPMPMPMPKHSK
jgi:FKBP-type peptidyl-prolyl cis-trans isomerase